MLYKNEEENILLQSISTLKKKMDSYSKEVESVYKSFNEIDSEEVKGVHIGNMGDVMEKLMKEVKVDILEYVNGDDLMKIVNERKIQFKNEVNNVIMKESVDNKIKEGKDDKKEINEEYVEDKTEKGGDDEQQGEGQRPPQDEGEEAQQDNDNENNEQEEMNEEQKEEEKENNDDGEGNHEEEHNENEEGKEEENEEGNDNSPSQENEEEENVENNNDNNQESQSNLNPIKEETTHNYEQTQDQAIKTSQPDIKEYSQVLKTFLHFIQMNITKYNTIYYSKTNENSMSISITSSPFDPSLNFPNNLTSHSSLSKLQHRNKIMSSSELLFPEIIPLAIADFIQYQYENGIKLAIVDLEDPSPFNPKPQQTTSKFFTSLPSKKASLRSSRSLSSIKSIRTNLSSRYNKVNIIDKALNEIFQFYSKQHNLIGKDFTFESYLYSHQHWDMGEFMKFCKEFKVNINHKSLMNIFLSYSHNRKDISFEKFKEVLTKLSYELNELQKTKLKNEYIKATNDDAKIEIKNKYKLLSNKTTDELINEFYNYLGVDSKIYKTKMKGFLQPFDLYNKVDKEEKYIRIPKSDFKLYHDKKMLSSHILYQKNKVSKYLTMKSQKQARSDSLKLSNQLKQSQDFEIKRHILQMKLIDREQYEKYKKMQEELNKIRKESKKKLPAAVNLSWNDMINSDYKTFVYENKAMENEGGGDIFQNDLNLKDRDDEDLQRFLKNKQIRRGKAMEIISSNNILLPKNQNKVIVPNKSEESFNINNLC